MSETEKKPLSEAAREKLKKEVIEMLKGVYDPELPVDIYNLGLIYDVIIEDDYTAKIIMTLTTPACPVAEILPIQAEEAAKMVKDIKKSHVELTFDPPWHPDMMSDVAKLECGLM